MDAPLYEISYQGLPLDIAIVEKWILRKKLASYVNLKQRKGASIYYVRKIFDPLPPLFAFWAVS